MHACTGLAKCIWWALFEVFERRCFSLIHLMFTLDAVMMLARLDLCFEVCLSGVAFREPYSASRSTAQCAVWIDIDRWIVVVEASDRNLDRNLSGRNVWLWRNLGNGVTMSHGSHLIPVTQIRIEPWRNLKTSSSGRLVTLLKPKRSVLSLPQIGPRRGLINIFHRSAVKSLDLIVKAFTNAEALKVMQKQQTVVRAWVTEYRNRVTSLDFKLGGPWQTHWSIFLGMPLWWSMPFAMVMKLVEPLNTPGPMLWWR